MIPEMTIKSPMFSVRARRNTVKIKKYTLDRIEKIFKEAVREYIKAAIAQMRVDTGMSVATFMPLAARVQYRQEVERLAIGGGAKRGHKYNAGDYPVPDNNAQYKSKAFGAKLGKNAYDLKFATITVPVFRFKFYIVALQHFIHENNSNPWGSLRAGEKAFNDYLLAHLKTDLPDYTEWLVNGRLV